MTSALNLDHVRKVFPAQNHPNSKHYKPEFVAVENVSLDIKQGEFVSIVGPSGCGKSTLLDLIAGLTKPSAGQILLSGKQITQPGLDRGIVFSTIRVISMADGLRKY